jgi:hypothetical protein
MPRVLTIAHLYGILGALVQTGHGGAAIVVDDDGGLSPHPNVVWHPNWSHTDTLPIAQIGQLEIVKGASALRGTMIFDAHGEP